jgi:hypothetical protein
MAKRLEVIVSAVEIIIRSSVKPAGQKKPHRRPMKGRRKKTSARM